MIPLEMHGGLPFVRAKVEWSEIANLTIAPDEVPVAPLAGELPRVPLLAVPVPDALVQEDLRAGAAKGLKEPAIPTPAEVSEHELTHLPAKPWCEHCIRGRGRDEVHRSTKNDHIDQVVPLIEMDYFFVTDTQDSQTGLVAVCRSTGYSFCSAVAEKGPKCAYGVASMVSWLRAGTYPFHPPVGRRAVDCCFP